MSFIVAKLGILTANLRLLPLWLVAAYLFNLGLMFLWHLNIRPSLGFTSLWPTVMILLTGAISGLVVARIVLAGYPQSLLMPLTTAIGGLMPIAIGTLLRGEPASPGRIGCLLGAIALAALASLF